MPFVLETPRLGLRPMNSDDLPALRGYLQDPRVMYAFGGPFDEPQVMQWFWRQLERYAAWRDFGSWALVLKQTGEMIGQCGLTLPEIRGQSHMEVGYILAHSHWGQGYATEAAVACRDFALGALGRDHVVSCIRCDNMASMNVAIRNGMQVVDYLESYHDSPLPTLVFRVDKASL